MTIRALVKVFFLLYCMQFFTLQAQVDTVKENLKFDFGFTRSSNINLWPLYKQVNTLKYKEIDVLFPFFVKKSDENKGTNYLHLAPVFFKSKTPAYKDFRLFSFYYPSLFHYHKDSNNVKSYRFLEVLPRFSLMDIRKSNRGIYLDQNFLFFIWFRKDNILQQSHFVVFPLSWYFRNGTNKSYTFFPLFSKGNNEENKYMAITPLFWHFSDGKVASNTLIPLWFNKKSLDPDIKHSSNVIFPLWWSSKDILSTKRVLFPLYWDMDVYKYHSVTLFPLFSKGRSKDNKESHLVITPLYWQNKNQNESNKILLPIWWKNSVFSKQDTTTTSVIFPLSWNIKNKRNHTYTFFPLFSYGHYPRNSYFAVTPIYWHTENYKRVGNTIFPIFWLRKSKDLEKAGSSAVLFPVYWSHTYKNYSEQMLIPIYWEFTTPDYHSITIAPFYSAGQNADASRRYFAVTPFYWNRTHPEGHSRTLFPVFWNNTRYRGSDTLKTNVLFPIWWDFASKNHHNRMLFPIYGSFQGKNYSSTTLMPFFSKGRSTYGRTNHLAITPFYWHVNRPGSTTSLLLPLYYHRKAFRAKDTLRTTMGGILWWSVVSSKNHYTHVLFPVFWNVKDETQKMITLFPLFYSYKQADNTCKVLRLTPLFHHSLRDSILSTVLFPVYWNTHSSIKADPYRDVVLFPVYWSKVHTDFTSRTLFPLLWINKTKNYSSFTLFPLLSTGRSADKQYYHLTVTPLFWLNHQQNKNSSYLIPVWWHSTKITDGILTKRSVLFPVYYSDTYGNEESKVLFPLVWYYKDIAMKSLTIIPFYTKQWSVDGKHSNTIFLPLVWQRRDTSSVRFTVFPFFWYKRSEHLSYHSFVPFYFYSSSPKTRNFQFLVLLYNYRRNQDESIYNGILWKTVYWNKYKDGGHEFRLFYLLYADVNKKDLVEKSYFPIYYYSKVKNTDITKAWLLYFYSRSTHYIAEIKNYYIEERIFWFLRIRSNYRQLEREGKAGYIKHRRHPKPEMPSVQ